jgi:hypothetical protein
VFLGAYVVGAVTLADHLPKLGWVRLLYFAIVGVAWGLPLLPLISWAERGRQDLGDRDRR